MSKIYADKLTINNDESMGKKHSLNYLWVGDSHNNYLGTIDKINDLRKLIKMCEKVIKNIKRQQQGRVNHE